MKIQSGAEVEFVLAGEILRVNAKCNDVKHHDGFGTGFNRAHWTVKFTFGDRAASFKYTVGEGNAGYDTELDFDCFAECMVTDMRAGESSYDDFCGDLGYNDALSSRAVYAACIRNVEKLNRVFGIRRDDFVEQSYEGGWQCLLASAAESSKSA